MCHIVEALSLWSKVRADQQNSLVKAWAANLVEAIESVNAVHWLCLQAVVGKAECLRQEDSGTDDASGDHWAAFSADLDDYLPDDCKFELFCRRAMQMLKSVSSGGSLAQDINELIERLNGPLLQSTRLRVQVTLALATLAALPFDGGLAQMGPDPLVADWRSKSQQGSPKDSSLARILDFLEALEKVRSSSDLAGDFPAEDVTVSLMFGEGESVVSLQASQMSAMCLAEEMPDWPCVSKIRSLATGSLQLVAGMFADALHLDGAALAGVSPQPQATTTAEFLQSFAVILQGGPGAKVAAKALAKKPRDAKAWPAEDRTVAGVLFVERRPQTGFEFFRGAAGWHRVRTSVFQTRGGGCWGKLGGAFDEGPNLIPTC